MKSWQLLQNDIEILKLISIYLEIPIITAQQKRKN